MGSSAVPTSASHGDASTKGIASRWRNIRRLYPIYIAISTAFKVGPAAPYENLSDVTEEQEPDAIGTAEQWMLEMDGHIQPFHLRSVLQQTDVASTEPKLLALVQRHASKSNRSQLDSDKLNFLMTQYLWACAPPSFRSREMTILEAAEVLEPVLGSAPSEFAPWLRPLQEALVALRQCQSIAELRDGQFVDRGRELRSQVGARYFERSSLLLFAYFNCCLRQAFVRVIAIDSKRIEDGLEKMKSMGAEVALTISTSPVPLSDDDVRARLLHLNTRAVGEYGLDETWKEMPEIRNALDAAIASARSGSMSDQRVSQLQDTLQVLLEQISSMKGEIQALRQASGAPAPRQTLPFNAPAIPEHDMGFEVEVHPPAPQPARPTPPPSTSPSAAYMPPEAVEPPARPAPNPVPATPAPAAQAAPPPVAAPPPAPVEPQVNVAAEFAERLLHLKQVLQNAKTATGLVPIGNTAIVLSAGEVEQVLQGTDQNADIIRQAIAARMVLVDKLEQIKNGTQISVKPFRDEAERLQTHLGAIVKQAGPTAPLGIVAATTGKQLAAVLRATPRR